MPKRGSFAKKARKRKKADRSISLLSPFFKTLKEGVLFTIRTSVNLWNSFPSALKRKIGFVFCAFWAGFYILALLDKGGILGEEVERLTRILVGETIFLLPALWLMLGFSLLVVARSFLGSLFLGFFLVVIGSSGIFGVIGRDKEVAGLLGFYITERLYPWLGPWLLFFIFLSFVVLGFSVFWYFLSQLLYKEKTSPKILWQGVKTLIFSPKVKVTRISEEPNLPHREEKEKEKKPTPKVSLPSEPTLLPPLELLETRESLPEIAGDIKQNMEIIKETLENFGIEVTMGEVNIGPTVTQYTLRPAPGVRLSKIVSLTNNLALNLASHPIRIEAPIPGKSLVGIEVPNKKRGTVRLGSLLASPEFYERKEPLLFALGKTVTGESFFEDLSSLPHLLVAGATGSGKTIFLNVLILSFLYRNTPQTLRFILIDPKRVEFSFYQDLPHLLAPVVLEVERAVSAFSWLVSEMERRFEFLREEGVKDIQSFNAKAKKEKEKPLPYIVVVVDELADLMASKGKEIEAYIVRLAQMARAVGIHLVIATQRPSVEVLTGLIKANITARISFQVATQFDSRTILDVSGAEKLLGAGDMLYVSPRRSKPQRIQSAFVTEEEIKRVVEWIRENQTAEDLVIMNFEDFQEEIAEDPLYDTAKEIVVKEGRASASLLQRRLRIGYNRAARLLELLEERGVVGPERGSKGREVYIKPEDLGIED